MYISEVFQIDRSTRVFVDIDFETSDDITEDHITNCADEVIDLMTEYGIIHESYTVYSSSRPGKISLHIYSDIYMDIR